MDINVDLNSTNVKELDFNKEKDMLHIESTINLSYNQVRGIADIVLKTRKGEGYLQSIERDTTRLKTIKT